MKLPLATGVLSSTPPPAPLICWLRIDRIWDRKEQPRFPHDDLPDTSYRSFGDEASYAKQWDVTVDGDQVLLTSGKQRLRGRETSNMFNERRFEITESQDARSFAGGRFVMRGTDAEITLFGSGVPILSSERGKLIPR